MKAEILKKQVTIELFDKTVTIILSVPRIFTVNHFSFIFLEKLKYLDN